MSDLDNLLAGRIHVEFDMVELGVLVRQTGNRIRDLKKMLKKAGPIGSWSRQLQADIASLEATWKMLRRAHTAYVFGKIVES